MRKLSGTQVAFALALVVVFTGSGDASADTCDEYDEQSPRNDNSGVHWTSTGECGGGQGWYWDGKIGTGQLFFTGGAYETSSEAQDQGEDWEAEGQGPAWETFGSG